MPEGKKADKTVDGVVAQLLERTAGPHCEWSDLDLVACLSNENGDAYAELYRRHSASVAAAARMILVNDERCQDVVAEVFVGLWFFPEKFEPSRGSLLAFLRMKAWARSIDIVRSEVARKNREYTEYRASTDYTKDADASLVGSESAFAVRQALALLPPHERHELGPPGVDRVIFAVTVTCGVLTAFAGILTASQLSTGDPTITANYLLPAFAAAFLGSTVHRRPVQRARYAPGRCCPGRRCRRARAWGCTGVDSEPLQRRGSSIGRWVRPGAAFTPGADRGHPAIDPVHRRFGEEWDALINRWSPRRLEGHT